MRQIKAFTRGSNSNLTDVVQLLQGLPLDEHMDALDRTPFIHLIRSIRNNKVDLNHCKRYETDIKIIVKSYDIETGKFRIGNVDMKPEEEDARLIFGIVDGNRKISSKLKKCPSNDFVRRLFPYKRDTFYEFGKIEIEKELYRTNDSDDFARLITLFILAALLDPGRGTSLKGYYVEYVTDLDTICSYNWSEHVIEKLNESIKKKRTGSSGCVLLLAYWLCERTKYVPEIHPNLFPRFLIWDLGLLHQTLRFIQLRSIPITMIRLRSEQVKAEDQALLQGVIEEEMDGDDSEEETEDDCSEEMEGGDSGEEMEDDFSEEEMEEDDSKGEKMEQMLCQSRKRGLEEIVLKDVCIRKSSKSTETGDACSSCPNIHVGQCDADNTRTVRKELHEIDVGRAETTAVSECYLNQPSNNISEPALKFENVKGFGDFNIYVNGENLDKEIPLPIKMKYYELCCNQNKFLHAHLTKGRKTKLVAGMILEIVSIADDIKAATVSTSPENLEDMDRTLKSFEDLGMTVAFLRVRLQKLILLSRQRQTVTDLKKTKSSEVEKRRIVLHEMISEIASLDAEIDTLEKKTEKLDDLFKMVADSQW